MQIIPPRRWLDILAEWNVCDLFKRTRLYSGRNPLLLVGVRTVDPRIAQLLKPWVIGPTNPGSFAVAQSQRDQRVQVVNASRIEGEHRPSPVCWVFSAVPALHQSPLVHRNVVDIHPTFSKPTGNDSGHCVGENVVGRMQENETVAVVTGRIQHGTNFDITAWTKPFQTGIARTWSSRHKHTRRDGLHAGIAASNRVHDL
jgi:hypothetical protein